MSASTITLVVNGNAYQLSATNTASLRAINPCDRRALLMLLEALKYDDQLAPRIADRVLPQTCSTITDDVIVEGSHITESLSQERMGSGDVDALMAKLIAEDQQSRKSQKNRPSMIKWAAMLVMAIILLVVIF